MIFLILVFSFILTATAFLSRYHWLLDLTAHFRFQYALIQLIGIFYCCCSYQYLLLGFVILFFLHNLSEILPLYFFPRNGGVISKEEKQARVNILSVNVLIDNTDYEKIDLYIAKVNPDILVLAEIDLEWINHMADVLVNFPYQTYELREDGFGIGFFSKISTSKLDIHYYGKFQVPSILASIEMNGKVVDILATHPAAPTSWLNSDFRNEQLSCIVEQRNQFNQNLILLGDLNITSWSFHFKEFIKKTKLYDARCGFGPQITWPSFFPLLGITIDHCLVSEGILVKSYKTGPNIGSDHYPILVEITF